MTKFISRLKDISSKRSTGASTEPMDTLKSEEKLEKEDRQGLRQRRQVKRTLLHLKRFSTQQLPQAFIKQFTGAKPLYRRYSFWIGLGMGGSAIALGMGWMALERSLPDTGDIIKATRTNTLTIRAADNKILFQKGPATRERLKIEKIPEKLIQSFIAIEDKRFYKHNGVDYIGVIRAAVSNVVARDVVEGGSTITQQLVRIILLDQERSLTRKLREIRLAQKVEEQLSKDQILERYLNVVYLGEGAYGVADAAWVYFSKTVYELNVAEMATLAAIPPAPGVYSPITNPQGIQARRNIVLDRMQELGFITAEEAKTAKAIPLVTKRSSPRRLNRDAPYFTEYIITQELPKYVSQDALKAGGLTVETTVKPEWQKAAEEAIATTIEKNGRWQNFKQASLVAIDPRTGEIRAMVGGKDFFKHQFNRVTQAKRQPGSTFKTFVYATAVAAGVSPNRSYLDAPFTVDGYTPKNYNEEKFRGWITIRDALISSINIVAVKALIDVGWDPVIKVAQKMGIESKLQPTYSLALGASEVTLLELTSAYGTLATQGLHTQPYGIRRVLDRRGKVIYEAKFKPERALDKDTSAIMTWMLRGVVTNGTGAAAQLGNRPVAGKTGTSDEARDLWFVGYIPQMVAGVWLGNDNNKPTWGASSTAAYTWHKFMEKVVEEMPVEKFPERPKLEGRKGQIKLQRIRPGKIVYGQIKSEDSTEEQTPRRRRRYQGTATENSATEYRPRRRRRRQEVQYQQPEEQAQPRRRRRRRSTQTQNTEYQGQNQGVAEQPTRRRRRRYRQTENTRSQEATPVRQRSRRRRSYNSYQQRGSATAPASQRGSDGSAPLAPPAARKSE